MTTTTHTPQADVHRPHLDRWLLATIALAAIFAAAIVGYAIAGGFTGRSTPGQEVADGVMSAWAPTSGAAPINAIYDPAVKVVLVYDNADHVVASSAEELSDAKASAIASGLANTYRQIGPVAAYVAEDGDTYVATLVEVKGRGHPAGDPLIGFYRVRDGKVIRHVFLDAEHY